MRSRIAGRTATEYVLSHDVLGLHLSWRTIEDEVGEIALPWTAVNRAIAFKRDHYAVDLICIVIFSESDSSMEIHEEMNGWQVLLDLLPTYLPGCTAFSDWWLVVAFPAFAANETTIYCREASS